MSLLVDTFAVEDFDEGAPEDFHIQGKAHVVDIPHIEFKFFFPAEAVSAIHLCPSGDAGAHFVAAGLLGGVERQVFYKQWARTDKTHVAFDDVDELGEFVQAGGADKFANGRDAVLIGQKLPGSIAFISHSFELDEVEDFTVFAGTGLDEKGIALVYKN